MSHVRTSTFFTKPNTKPNKILDIVSFSGPRNWCLSAQTIAPLIIFPNSLISEGYVEFITVFCLFVRLSICLFVALILQILLLGPSWKK